MGTVLVGGAVIVTRNKGLYAGVSVTMHLTYSEVFLRLSLGKSYRWIRNKFALDSYSIINIHIRKDNK